MSAKDLKALTRRYFNEINKEKAAATAAMDEFYALDIVSHSGTGEDIHGLKDYKQYMSEFYSAFPDAHFTVDDMVV